MMIMIGIHSMDIVNKVVEVQKKIIETLYSLAVIDFFKLSIDPLKYYPYILNRLKSGNLIFIYLLKYFNKIY